MARGGTSGDLLLGEWACLGILYGEPTHGFAVAAHLKPDAHIGRIWSMSRALTYRSLEQLTHRALVRPIGHEPGIAGGNRTILEATRSGRALFRSWVHSPTEHLRDLRSELLLKIALAAHNEIDITDTLIAQRARITEFVAHHDQSTDDVVQLWRYEAGVAALRFLERLSPHAAERAAPGRSGPHPTRR